MSVGIANIIGVAVLLYCLYRRRWKVSGTGSRRELKRASNGASRRWLKITREEKENDRWRESDV
jgi:hypothetical protein